MDPVNFAQPEDYARAEWRVIIHRAADGPMNMAIDEAIAEHVGAGIVKPTLRFYEWHPACLSLGYTQPASDVDFDRLAERGWQVVRRLSGGRAILHTDELTYSVSVPVEDPRVMGGVVESYRRLSRGLMLGVQQLGADVSAEKASSEAHGFKGPVCFEMPSDYEITAEGRKLFGSAQTRRSNHVVMQHGTLPLQGDITRICDALVFTDEAAREHARHRVLERAMTLEAVLGRLRTYEEAAVAMQAGFAQALNLTLAQDDLTPAEWTRAVELREEKYSTPAWNEKL